MRIKVNLKQLGKRRNKISAVEFELEHNPANVKELICEVVHTCVESYNSRVRMGEQVSALTPDEVDKMSELGKIAFGINYGGKEADEKKALENALQSYEDGLFRIFWDDRELGELSESIGIAEDDTITFIRLTMLSGRMW